MLLSDPKTPSFLLLESKVLVLSLKLFFLKPSNLLRNPIGTFGNNAKSDCFSPHAMLAPWWGENIISGLLSYSSLLLPSLSSSVLVIETRHYLREMYIMSTLCPELSILFWKKLRNFCKVLQFSLVTQSCLTLCNPMNHSMPGLPVHHKLLEFTQTHVHRVSDAIQPSHPLSSPSLPTFNLSQNQGLFQWVGSSHHVAKVLEFQLQHQSFRWIFRTNFL